LAFSYFLLLLFSCAAVGEIKVSRTFSWRWC